MSDLMTRPAFVILILLLIFDFIERSDGGILSSAKPQRITLQAASFDFTNPDYLGPGAYIRVMRRTRKSLPTLSAYFPFLVDLSGNVSTTYVVFQRLDNRWKETVFKGAADMCESLKTKIKVYRMMYNYSNFPCQCPVLKGNYTITDFKFDAKDPLPSVGAAEGRIKTSWTHGGTLFMVYWFEIKIGH